MDVQQYADDHGLEVKEIVLSTYEYAEFIKSDVYRADPGALMTSALEGKFQFLGIPITRSHT